MAKRQNKSKNVEVTIKPLNKQKAIFHIRGTSILVQNRFSEKAKRLMIETQEAGSTAKKGKNRKPKDFEELYKATRYTSNKAWYGHPASGFRNAMISACKLCGFAMTRAKLSIFVIADGYDKNDMTPLVKITKGTSIKRTDPVRISKNTTDIRSRAMFAPGWEMKLTIEWDADQFTLDDVTNLLVRVGEQVGIGEGRNDSKTSAGMGWGSFTVLGKGK